MWMILHFCGGVNQQLNDMSLCLFIPKELPQKMQNHLKLDLLRIEAHNDIPLGMELGIY